MEGKSVPELSPLEWAIRPLKRYAQFSGRAPRAEYWWFWLAYMLGSLLIQILARAWSVLALLGIVYLGLVIPVIATGVRRLHDTDRSGWWLLAPFVPYALGFAMMIPAMRSNLEALTFASFGPAMVLVMIGFVLAIVVLVFTILPGTRGPNRFGPDPYEEDDLEEVFA